MKTPEQDTPQGELGGKFLELIKPVTVFSLETNPRRNFGERVTAIVLRPLMLLKAGGKLSHWFDWHQLPEDFEINGENGIEIPADSQASKINYKNRIARRFALIRMSLGGWQTVYLVGPDPKEKTVYKEGWRIAFLGTGKDKRRQYSTIVNHSPVLALAGPTPVYVRGIRRDNFEGVPLRIVGPIEARGRSPII